MIFVWIGYLVRFIGYLFIPPEVIIPMRSNRAVCPVCGGRRNKLSAATNGNKPALRHDCLICSGQWFEDTAMKAADKMKVEEPSVK